ncbi:MAG: transglutaminase domain-containing protein, partial [Anaerovoracaceae bacterium]|nr:transglutaminase domain-containing protein [Anaerovoracaceae bacterium]
HPEMFYVSASGIQIYPNRSNKTVVKLVPKYTMSKSQAATATKRMNTQAKAIEKKVNRKWSVKKKALTVNNLLKSRVRYTSSGANKQNAYGALVEGKGVCQAYTMAYEYIMSDLGIRTSYELSNSGNHIWNTVKYGNRWYRVDVTWNDTTKSNRYFWKTSHAK